MKTEYVKQELKKVVSGSENFDNMIEKIANYIIKNYAERKVEVDS
jgi:hypothetical protein